MSTEQFPADDTAIEQLLEDIREKEEDILRDEQAILKDEERILKEEVKQHEHHQFNIQIDREHYTVREHHLSGAQLRQVPSVPIGPDRDLFEVVSGGSDRKVGNAESVEIRSGLRFFTAPGQINPGMKDPGCER